MDRDQAPDARSPPWDRQQEEQRWGLCDYDGAIGYVTNRYFQHLYPSFCDGTAWNMALTSDDFLENPPVPESTEAPLPQKAEGQGWKFRFSYEKVQGSAGTGVCTKTCHQAYNALSKGNCEYTALPLFSIFQCCRDGGVDISQVAIILDRMEQIDTTW